jgi:tetratricopeptide (TPR) repeat protein
MNRLPEKSRRWRSPPTHGRRVSWILGWVVVWAVPAGAQSTADIEAFTEGLRQQQMAPLAVEYLRLLIERGDLADTEKGNYALELATSLVATAESGEDLAERERRLDEAKRSLDEFARDYPKHPRLSDALVQRAAIAMNRGRLRLLEADLPAQQHRAGELASKARELFASARKDYEVAHERIKAELSTLTGFIDPKKDRALHRRRERLFADEVESDFQVGLASYFTAESFLTGGAPISLVRVRPDYRSALSAGLKVFEKVHNDHRRELAGLFGHLWSARCLIGLGEYKRADVILESLLEHDNPELAGFQRQVFHFRLLSQAAQGKHDAVIELSESWLKTQARFREENAYCGVQMVSAESQIALSKKATEDTQRASRLRAANELLAALTRQPNIYTGQASRLQLAIGREMNRGVKATNFDEIFALGSARLDEIRPDMESGEKKTRLAEAIEQIEKAISVADKNEDPERLTLARLTLAFAYYQSGNLEKGIEIAESVLRAKPASGRAAEAGALALSGCAILYDRATKIPAAKRSAEIETVTARIESISKELLERYPQSPAADQARLLTGKLALAQSRYADAAGRLGSVQESSDDWPNAMILAASALWTLAQQETGGDKPPDKSVIADALAKAQSAADRLGDNPERFADRAQVSALLGEIFLAQGKPDDALVRLVPLISVESKDDAWTRVDPLIRTGLLVSAIRAYVELDQLPAAQKLVDQLGEGSTESATQALVSLVQSLRQRRESGASGASAGGYAAFLESVAARPKGQSPAMRVYLADAFLAIENPQRAAAMLNEVLSSIDADPATKTRARLLLARAESLAGQHAPALERVTALLKENPSAREVVQERGDILERAGDWPQAIKHWLWYLDRLKRIQPRPVETYAVADHLADLHAKWSSALAGAERQKALQAGLRLPAYLLETDRAMPGTWRETLTRRRDAMTQLLSAAR